jgi:hypothetical protein
MGLWEIFVLGQVRLCMNTSYDQLHYMANYDTLLRGVPGVLPTDFTLGREYGYQNIYDNVTLLDDGLLTEINDVIVQAGHRVFKKKEKDALRLKTDSFVVETDTHFPTGYSLLWDSARKCIDTAGDLGLPGWRKSSSWLRELKSLMRAFGKSSSGGGKNKEERVKNAALDRKVVGLIASEPAPGSGILDTARLEQLGYYSGMLTKHIDLMERRVIRGEAIPHS